MSSSETYFVAATIVTCGPTSSARRSYRSRTASGDVRDHSLPARASLVAPVREEAVRMTRRARVDAVDVLAARRAQRPVDAGPQIEPPVDGDVCAERLARGRGNLLPHLVAARADRGTDHRGELPRSERAHALRDDAGEQPAPADV